MTEPITDPAAATEPNGTAAQEPPTEPNGTDWQAMSRKWEQRSKDNLAKLKEEQARIAELEEKLAASSAIQEELDAARKRAEEAEAEAGRLQHERELASWADEASKATGVPASVLRGGSAEEMLAHAEEIKAAMASQHAYPALRATGEPAPSAGVTKESIMAIKNDRERLAAISEHIELFN